jgi:hypothetical protein
MSTYAIRVTISEREHNEDREEYRQAILAGDRVVTDEDTGLELSTADFAALDLDVQNAYADAELGDEWDELWLYPHGEEGLDPDARRLFPTREDAEAVAEAFRATSDSDYEVVEA